MTNKAKWIGPMTLIEGYGADAEYAQRVLRGGPQILETFALQNKSIAAREPLAKAVTGGRMGYDQLVVAIRASLRSTEEGLAKRFAEKLHAKPLIVLARIVADQALLPEDPYDSILLFKFALNHFGKERFRKDDRLVMLEQLGELGFRKDILKYSKIFGTSRYNPHQQDLLLANTYRPFAESHNNEHQLTMWLQHTNSMYIADGVEAIDVVPGDGHAIDRIACSPVDFVEGGPKVSVIIPTFNSGARISTAISSLLSQSWRNLEILIMDDCSPRSNDQHLYPWETIDSRIRVIRLAENRGTYKARNIAMTQYVTGDLVTVHDDDDWSHPRKIQTQVEHLLANPESVANVSLLSRATPDLKFTRINNNPIFLQRNFSSLMFWKQPVVERLGYWDLVNRSSDAEMHDRLVAAFGQKIGTAGNSAMSFLRVRSDSLTSGEIYKGYIDQRRLWYQRASRSWHARELGEGGSGSIWIGEDNTDSRAFKAPAGMIGSKQTDSRIALDIVYATDFRFPGGNSSISAAEIRLLLSRGYRVGLMQVDSPVLASRMTIGEQFFEIAQHENCSVVSRLDPVDVDLLMIRHPSVLQYINPSASSITSKKVIIIANHAPHGRNGKESLYDLRQVVRNALSVFGVMPTVIPESGLIRGLIRSHLSPAQIGSFDWNGTVEVPNREPLVSDVLRRPVIGRHARDHSQKWPKDPEVLAAVYPVTGEYDVRVLGGASHALEALKGVEPAWTVYEFGAMTPAEFLSELDFWVYFHDENLVESFGMSAAEAIAQGLVVVLPRYMEQTFGAGAVYAEPEEVLPLIEAFWGDPVRYRAQSQRALDHAQRNFSPDAFFSRIDSLTQSRREMVLQS
ncbi:MAG: glycosyltransferase [Arthrobacter sp.]